MASNTIPSEIVGRKSLDAIGTGDEVTETMAEGRCKMEEGTFVILSAEEEDDDLGGEDAQEHR